MSSANAASTESAPSSLAAVRRAAERSRGQISEATGLSRRTVRALESGRQIPSDSEVEALAEALGVEPSEILRAASASAGVRAKKQRKKRRRATVRQRDDDSDRLLREYISMVRELRDAQRVSAVTLREHDLSELAKALGGTPEAIEARLMELLDTDHEQAERLRTDIVPSW
jgi:transcriptional regulator with XRE-family HTH domain